MTSEGVLSVSIGGFGSARGGVLFVLCTVYGGKIRDLCQT